MQLGLCSILTLCFLLLYILFREISFRRALAAAKNRTELEMKQGSFRYYHNHALVQILSSVLYLSVPALDRFYLLFPANELASLIGKLLMQVSLLILVIEGARSIYSRALHVNGTLKSELRYQMAVVVLTAGALLYKPGILMLFVASLSLSLLLKSILRPGYR